MKAVVAAFNQEKALVGAFSVIVQPVVEPMDRFTALMGCGQGSLRFTHHNTQIWVAPLSQHFKYAKLTHDSSKTENILSKLSSTF